MASNRAGESGAGQSLRSTPKRSPKYCMMAKASNIGVPSTTSVGTFPFGLRRKNSGCF
jgi:hypothetical protein